MKLNLKNASYMALLIAGLHYNTNALAQEKIIHTIDVKNAKQLHDFFKFTGKDITIVSGHRGGIEMGFPENSIETFENTLKYLPSFFEIDPRLSKDSVIVLMHDATLNRTTNGKGQVSDYTLAELKKLRLKDVNGNLTDAQIPTLEEAIIWARGKTILSLDWKGVPFEMTANLVKKLKATHFVIVGLHSMEQAKIYLAKDKNFFFAKKIIEPTTLDELKNAGIPLNQVMAYVGADYKADSKNLYKTLNKNGMMFMIGAAPSYDKLKTVEERKNAYQNLIKQGVNVIETDLPIATYEALKALLPSKSEKQKYFGKKKI
ncbi:MAG: glycerophosphodiester phosphodiesterase family protein [Pedobacter sp.]|nr:MAG: glycerophosphodiester phosphodiesterase family protein [Pedobacter sp.]